MINRRGGGLKGDFFFKVTTKNAEEFKNIIDCATVLGVGKSS